MLFQCLAEASAYAGARALLAGEGAASERAVLGFGTNRARIGRNLRLVESDERVPSVATVWRHKQRFGLERHARAYEELFERLADEAFE